MTTKHTPGPWAASLGEFSFTNTGQRAVTTKVDEDEMPVHIAFISPIADRKRNTPYNAPDAERDANALVVAAAPDLLAACRAALVVAKRDAEFCVVDVDAGTTLGDVLRAAIAKAEGRET